MLEKITCKRQVFLKSIVTEEFKVDLAIELKGAIENLKQQLSQIGNFIKQQGSIGEDVKDLKEEQRKIMSKIKILQHRLQEAKEFKPGEIYTTGKVEGLVELRLGDDLREKLGHLEVICKDHIIQEIRTLKAEVS